MPSETITVGIAIYNPRLDWLEQLLKSLADQDYSHMEWLFIDDASVTITAQELKKLIKKYVLGNQKNIPFEICRNETNMGTNETYRRIIEKAKGDYIAFCDQDDIWKRHKLSAMYKAMKRQDGVLAYTDMTVIDKDGMTIMESFQKCRMLLKNPENTSGKGKAWMFLLKNYAPGCSVLVLKKAVIDYGYPPSGTYWDHWVNILAATKGRICYISEKLMYYRIHGLNQTGRFKDIQNKKDYEEKRLKPLYDRMVHMKREQLHFPKEQEVYAFIEARYRKDLLSIWHYRFLGKKEAYFEMLLILCPNWLITIICTRIK